MKVRFAAAACAMLVIIVGGVTWWRLGGDVDRTGSSTVSSPSGEPGGESPTGRLSSGKPTPQGRPVASCATAQPVQRLPETYWGMHVNSPIGDDFPEAPISAVNLTTSGVYWNQVETAPGQYDFSRLDDIVSTSQARDAQPMLLLGFTPSFHARQPASPTAKATMPDRRAWRAWVSAVVERYGDRLDYQVWPEANIVSNWAGTPAQMARLTVIAGQIIHDRAPDAVVVAPATTLRLEPQRQWMSRFWGTKVGGVPVADSVDAVALDPFPVEDGTPEDALSLICQARKILAKHDVVLPLWTNEINYGVPSGGTTGVKPYSDAQQAAVVARTYVLHAAMGIDRVYWLGWFSYPGVAVELARDGVTTAAGTAFATVHDWLAGPRRPSCSRDAGLYTCVVRSDAQTLTILWREGGTSKVRAPAGATRVESVAGERRRLRAGDKIRVGESPVAIVEPSGS